ncbi:MAG: glycosyltransferase family 4 protein [Propionivibrio sp.]|nr:glycosyltransferase family 4 protein [Propionivibrio sp.]
MTQKIRTLLFSTLYPSSNRPGHGIFVETRLRELLGTGEVETRVVAPVPWFFSTHPRYGDYARMAETPRAEHYNGIDIEHPRYLLPPRTGMNIAPLSIAIASIPAVRRIIKEGFDFDIIDSHYYYPDGVAAAMLARWFNKPFVVTARGTDLNLIPRYTLPRRMMQWTASRADASIGVCKALTDVLGNWGIPNDRLKVMRNGVDLERFHPLPVSEVRRELGLSGSLIMLSVGYLVERKGHHLVIDALAKLLPEHPDAMLIIIGEGVERRNLETQVTRLGLEKSVRFTGALPNKELSRWYSAADVLVLASSREGWANVLLESMACGTPVVATRIWGTPEVVTNTRVGRLADERTASKLASAVSELLASKPDRGYVRSYAEEFGWRNTSEAQVALFRQIVNNRRSRGVVTV